MDSSTTQSIQNALILNLVIFIVATTVHNMMMTDFSYIYLLSNITHSSLLPIVHSYFALANSSAIITGMIAVFAYAALHSILKLLSRRTNHSNELIVLSL